MKKTALSVAALAIAFVAAFSFSDASANKLWRFAPGQILVQPSQCSIPNTILCANEYTDAGVFVKQVLATYVP